MATWANTGIATVKARKYGSSDSFVFNGISSDDTDASPDKVLAAINHILDFGGMSATMTYMTRTISQGVED